MERFRAQILEFGVEGWWIRVEELRVRGAYLDEGPTMCGELPPSDVQVTPTYPFWPKRTFWLKRNIRVEEMRVRKGDLDEDVSAKQFLRGRDKLRHQPIVLLA